MSTRRWFFLSLSMVVAAIFLAAELTPSEREGVQAYLGGHQREILATAEGDLLGNHTPVKVFKFKQNDVISVEILRVDKFGVQSLVDRLVLPDHHDGLFNFQGRVTRLAIGDIDGDGQLELIAPTFDNQLVPHLNVFRYNPAVTRFEPVQGKPQ